MQAERVTGIILCVGAWSGKVDLLTVPLYNFELILGVNFVTTTKAVVIHHLGGLVLTDETQP